MDLLEYLKLGFHNCCKKQTKVHVFIYLLLHALKIALQNTNPEQHYTEVNVEIPFL